MTTLSELQHASVLPAIVDLYTLDLTALGGGIFRLTATTKENLGSVVYDSLTYTPFPIMIDGVEHRVGDSAPPQPTITVSNINKLIQATVVSFGDMVGGKVTRQRVFRTNLDDGTDPDTTVYLPIEKYIINQKKAHNRQIISFVLVSEMDLETTKIPRRLIVKKDFPGVAKTRVLI